MAEPIDPEQLKRWRLVLGHHSQDQLAGMGGGQLELSEGQCLMDESLAAIYDETEGEGDGGTGRSAGLGASSPRLSKWLGDIRSFFSEDVVTVIQQDAIEKKGMTQLLFEPEMLKNVQPNVQLVGTLMALKGRKQKTPPVWLCNRSLIESSSAWSRRFAKPLLVRSIETSIRRSRT